MRMRPLAPLSAAVRQLAKQICGCKAAALEQIARITSEHMALFSARPVSLAVRPCGDRAAGIGPDMLG